MPELLMSEEFAAELESYDHRLRMQVKILTMTRAAESLFLGELGPTVRREPFDGA